MHQKLARNGHKLTPTAHFSYFYIKCVKKYLVILSQLPPLELLNIHPFYLYDSHDSPNFREKYVLNTTRNHTLKKKENTPTYMMIITVIIVTAIK